MKKNNRILKEISIEIPSLSKNQEGKIFGGFVGMGANIEAGGDPNHLCINRACINDDCFNNKCDNTYCNNNKCNNITCFITNTETATVSENTKKYCMTDFLFL